MEILVAFIFGSLFGSFLNVLIDRLSTGRGFLTGRSYCEHCKKELKAIDLIPLFSYLWLRGKCRYCKTKIPPRLFLVEFLSGIIASVAFSAYLQGIMALPSSILLFLIFWGLLGIFFADIEYGIIPDLLVGIVLIATLPYVVISGANFMNHLLSAFGAFLFFFMLFTLTRGKGMGFGDVKLVFALGLLLGFPGIIASLYLAFLTGAGVSIILVIWRKLRFYGGTIPFGPFLVGGAVIAFFYGELLLSYFLKGIF